jgi:flavin reductase (DIM6/NTAB) family NADH-FMN oxidoreductase RutF
MFYEPKDGHGFIHNPLNAIVIPRPIGWISTQSSTGVPNLAPYSFFNLVAYTPPQVMFSATGAHSFGGLKDAVVDAVATGEFAVNIATWHLREQMNLSAIPAPHNVDEFEHAGLEKAPCRLLRCPRVAESPIYLECKVTNSTRLLSDTPDGPNIVVFGEVVGIGIDESVITEGLIDIEKLVPVGRLGYLDFVKVNNRFAMERPVW